MSDFSVRRWRSSWPGGRKGSVFDAGARKGSVFGGGTLHRGSVSVAARKGSVFEPAPPEGPAHRPSGSSRTRMHRLSIADGSQLGSARRDSRVAVRRDSVPGAKVGLIAARRTGQLRGRKQVDDKEKK